MIDRENHYNDDDDNDDHDDHDVDHDLEEQAQALAEMAEASDVFLQMRQQNIELLKIAVQVAAPAPSGLKAHDLRNAMKNIWEVYSEFYEWIDPEDSEDEEEDDEEDED